MVKIKFRTLGELSSILQYLDASNISLKEIEKGVFEIEVSEEIYKQAMQEYMADSYT